MLVQESSSAMNLERTRMQEIHIAWLSNADVPFLGTAATTMTGMFCVHTKQKVYKEPESRAFVWA